MDYFKRVFGTSADSKPDEGITTVIPSRPAPAHQQNEANAVPEDPLLRHLAELQRQQPVIDAHSSSRKAADAESLLADVELVEQLGTGTGPLNSAVNNMLSTYHTWHTEHIQALTANQEYIARTIDQAEAKAAKAVRHVQLQTVRMRTLSGGLADAEGLPALLGNLTAAAAALEQQLLQLEQLTAQQQQQR